jgi:hypothetical protein
MGCNCGKGAGAVRRTTTGATGSSVVQGRMRSRVRFYVAPPPEDHTGDELVFDTLYEARAALRARTGWHLESRRTDG